MRISKGGCTAIGKGGHHPSACLHFVLCIAAVAWPRRQNTHVVGAHHTLGGECCYLGMSVLDALEAHQGRSQHSPSHQAKTLGVVQWRGDWRAVQRCPSRAREPNHRTTDTSCNAAIPSVRTQSAAPRHSTASFTWPHHWLDHQSVRRKPSARTQRTALKLPVPAKTFWGWRAGAVWACSSRRHLWQPKCSRSRLRQWAREHGTAVTAAQHKSLGCHTGHSPQHTVVRKK